MLNDWQTFCSSRGVGVSDFAREKPWRPPSLVLEADPPAHTRARAVLDRALAPAALRPLRAALAEVAAACVEAALASGECDAIPALAEAFPLAVFPDAMGLTREGRAHLLPYGSLAFNAFGPDNALRRAALAEAAPHVAWVAAQCRRENLAPDGIGAAIHAAADRGEITAEEAVLLVRSLLTAGLDTTVAAIGAALHCLAANPRAFAQLRADPTLARAAFEEALRLESPVQTFFRTTTRPIEVDGDRPRRGREGAAVPGCGQPRPAAVGAAGRVRPVAPHSGPCRLRLRRSHVRRPVAFAAGGRGAAGGTGAARGGDRAGGAAGAAPQQHAARACASAGAAARGVMRGVSARSSATAGVSRLPASARRDRGNTG